VKPRTKWKLIIFNYKAKLPLYLAGLSDQIGYINKNSRNPRKNQDFRHLFKITNYYFY